MFETGTPCTQAYLLVCLRGSANAFGLYDLNEARLAALSAALEAIAMDRGLEIVFLPFQQSKGEDDNRIHIRVANGIRRAPVRVLEWTGDIAAVIGIFAAARATIAMRLHAAVVSAALGRPCVVMPYDYKVREFVKQRGIATVLTTEALDAPLAARRVIEDALAAGALPPAPMFTGWDTLRLFRGAS
jgi:polysaccharide pyruvyl transferase WcaK-like protein